MVDLFSHLPASLHHRILVQLAAHNLRQSRLTSSSWSTAAARAAASRADLLADAVATLLHGAVPLSVRRAEARLLTAASESAEVDLRALLEFQQDLVQPLQLFFVLRSRQKEASCGRHSGSIVQVNRQQPITIGLAVKCWTNLVMSPRRVRMRYATINSLWCPTVFEYTCDKQASKHATKSTKFSTS